jgi:lycopene beta-cyclase
MGNSCHIAGSDKPNSRSRHNKASVEWLPMSAREYDVVFVGGGLSALLLLKELRDALPERVAVIDPSPPQEEPPVHWSYWSRGQTFYDHFAIGTWWQARVADVPPESTAPFTMRLVRSTDVFAHIAELLEDAPIEWLRTQARSISRLGDEQYEIATGDGPIRARWVFDSAPDVPPTFPTSRQPRAVLSGTGIHVISDQEVFDEATVTLFDPLDERSFAYQLPLGRAEVLLESASFDAVAQETDETPLLRYLRARHPETRFTVDHVESGSIPLGFSPSETTGPRHILLGTKRGLVKPSAGYGIVRIAEESEHLAGLWRENRPLPPTWRANWRWRLLDKGFLQLAAQDPRLPLALLHRVMRAVPLAGSLGFIDEELPLRQLAAVFRSALPVVLGRR